MQLLVLGLNTLVALILLCCARGLLSNNPQRLKFAWQVAMHDIASAVEKARRSVAELGAVAIIGTQTRSTASICTTRHASRCGES